MEPMKNGFFIGAIHPINHLSSQSPERERVGHSSAACWNFARSVTFGALTKSALLKRSVNCYP
jgi:hypothetical protein